MNETVEYEALGQGECIRLLAGARVGRLALHAGALPTVAVVDALLTEDGVVVKALPEPWFVTATEDAVVAFEADGVDGDGRGRWSVVVVGEAGELDDLDPEARARLDVALHARSTVGLDRLVLVSLGMISGRRQMAAADATAVLQPAA